MLKKIPLQLHQNINLVALLLIGSILTNIHLGWIDILSILLFSLFVEHLFLYLNPKREFYLSYSALSTAISLVFLLYSAHLWVYFIVIILGLFQKHFITIDGKQFFNPSNFAIVIAMLFFYEDARLISGQFGNSDWLAITVSILAIIILIRAKRWIISLSFIIFYLMLEYWLVVCYDPVMIFEDIEYRLYSISFTLFIYFMLTDPAVTPSKWYQQIVFALVVALFSVLLDRFLGFRVEHLFLSVFLFSSFVPLLDMEMSLGNIIKVGVVSLLAIAVIILIEIRPPYYFEMQGSI